MPSDNSSNSGFSLPSFQQLWDNVGRWVVPGGLVIDFVASKVSEFRSEMDKIPESSVNQVMSAVGPSPVTEPLPIKAVILDNEQIELLRQEQQKVSGMISLFESAGLPAPQAYSDRNAQLASFFEHHDKALTASDPASLAQTSLGLNSSDGLVTAVRSGGERFAYDRSQAQVLAQALEQEFPKSAGVSANQAIDQAGWVLASTNRQCAHSPQAVGAVLTLNGSGDISAVAVDAPNLLNYLNQVAQVKKQIAQTTELSGQDCKKQAELER